MDGSSEPNAIPSQPDERTWHPGDVDVPTDLASEGSPLLPEPAGWTDPLTGAEGPRYWDRLISGEQARLRRHKRAVTITLMELVGFEEMVAWVGRDSTLQAFTRLSRALVSQVRSSDHIARIAPNRFALLLVETDELQALNFIDRVLRHVRAEIEGEGHEVRVGVGWASPGPTEKLAAAIALAEERLATDFFHTL